MALGKVLGGNRSLRELSTSAHNIGVGGCRALGAALSQNRTLEVLDVGHGEAGDEQIVALTEGLSSNRGGCSRQCSSPRRMMQCVGIKRWTLEAKSLTSTGAKEVGKGEKEVVAWALACCDSRGEAVTLLLPFLVHWRATSSDLLVSYSSVLCVHPALETLNMSRNPIGQEGLESLLKGATANETSSLSVLILKETSVRREMRCLPCPSP